MSVEPGGQASISATITSSSSIVEGFTLDVVGTEPSKWAEVIPPSVDVYPGAEASAVIVFSPPPGATAQSGVFPFGLRARSTEDAGSSAVAEGDVTLGKVSGLQAKIVPVTSNGRWRGRHTIQLSNWGNTPVQLQLVASDPDAALGFYLRPDLVDLPMGASATVRMTVRTRKPFLRGTPTRLPFQVVGEPAGAPDGPRPPTPYGDPSRPVVDGALNQKPILSKAFVTLLALVLVAAIGGGVYAFTRKKPTPASLDQLGPPEKPKNFVVVATGPETIKATWTPIPQVTGYQILDIDPDTEDRRGSVAVNGSLNQTTIDKLKPNTKYCYQLEAQREAKSGPASDVECTTTPPPVETASPTPSTGTASPSGDPSSSASGGGPSESTGPGGDPSTGGNPPPGGDPPHGGDPSQGTGNPTTDGSPGQPPAGGPVGNGTWVVIGGSWPGTDADLPADARVKLLKEKGFPNALVIDTDQYPKLTLNPGHPQNPATFAVVGPYGSRPEAQAAEVQVKAITKSTTFVLQPAPS